MSRIEAARRRVTIARYAIGITAAAALAAFAAAARVSHPGTSHATSSSRASTRAATAATQDDSFFTGDDSGSSIGPSGSAPAQVQSGAS